MVRILVRQRALRIQAKRLRFGKRLRPNPRPRIALRTIHPVGITGHRPNPRRPLECDEQGQQKLHIWTTNTRAGDPNRRLTT